MRRALSSVIVGLVIGSVLVVAGAPLVGAGEKLLNINTASVEELAGAKGIGEVKAKAIVAYRAAHGPFKSVDDLTEVKGIGPRLLTKLRPQVTVGTDGAPPAAAPAAQSKK